MTPNPEGSIKYKGDKGGCWSNTQVSWVTPIRTHGNPAYYSSVGLGFRTSLAGRRPR
jgi:hypothetical protein